MRLIRCFHALSNEFKLIKVTFFIEIDNKADVSSVSPERE